jgi:hypothetical protein
VLDPARARAGVPCAAGVLSRSSVRAHRLGAACAVLFHQGAPALSEFSRANVLTELAELARAHLSPAGRLQIGTYLPHVVPVGFRFNADGTIDIGGPHMASSQKYRRLRRPSASGWRSAPAAVVPAVPAGPGRGSGSAVRCLARASGSRSPAGIARIPSAAGGGQLDGGHVVGVKGWW